MFNSEETFKFQDRIYRTAEEMSKRTYLFVLTLLIAGGLALGTYIGSITYTMNPNFWWFVGYFVLAIPGVIISVNSDNWVFSLFGYGLVIFPTGAIVGPYTYLYTPESVLQVALITIGASTVIGVAGMVYPKSVEHWGGFFMMGLLVVIFGDIARIFLVSYGMNPVSLSAWDWVAAFLFCGLIFYDMNRAIRLPRTMDNAVDSAVALYLDILNLFIRLLAIMGESKK